MRNHTESLANVIVNNIYCLLLMHKSSYFIIESNQVAFASFILGKCMLVISRYFVVTSSAQKWVSRGLYDFLGIKVRQSNLHVPESSFLPFLRMSATFVFL